MVSPCEWTHKQRLETNLTPTGGQVLYGAHHKFPWALTEDNLSHDFFSILKADAGDLRFTSDEAGKHEIPFDIVNYDAGGSKIYVRVSLPVVTDKEATEFWAWGGNPSANLYAADSEFGAEKVWWMYEVAYIVTPDILTGSVTDRAGRHTLSKSADMTSDNIKGGKHYKALKTYSAKKYINIDTLRWVDVGGSENDFYFHVFIRITGKYYCGIFGNEVNWNESGAGAWYVHHNNEAYEFDSGDWDYIGERELKPTVPLEEWYLTANGMFKGHHHAFTNDVGLTHQQEFEHSRDSTLSVTIGSTGSNHAHGKIEEFMYIKSGAYSSEYHMTYSQLMYRTEEATTSYAIQSAAFYTPVLITIHVSGQSTGDQIEGARVLILNDSDSTVIANDVTGIGGTLVVPFVHSCDITISGKARKGEGQYYKAERFGGRVTENGEEIFVFMKRDW